MSKKPNKEKHITRILSVLQDAPSTSLDISDETGIGSGLCRVLVSSLKREGVIEIAGSVVREDIVRRRVNLYRLRSAA